VGFEPTISTGERPQTYALDRAATGTGIIASVIALKIHAFGRKVYDLWMSSFLVIQIMYYVP
jgi:hypothetical protein